LLLVSVTSFALAGLRATQAAAQWQEWSSPPREGIFDRPSDGVALGRIAQAAAVLRSAGRNSSRARLKVTLMRRSVSHLQNALIALVVLAAVLVAYAIAGSSTAGHDEPGRRPAGPKGISRPNQTQPPVASPRRKP
jgi:hypothetical protein